MMDADDKPESADEPQAPPRKIQLGQWHVHLPQSRSVRIGIGCLLILFGLLGFLPVLGFWMVPLGLLVLSYEFDTVRRRRRRLIVWWERRRRPNGSTRD